MIQRLFLLLLLLTACASGDTWERIQQEQILRVGLDPTYPPFENADGGELVGIDVDLMRALAETLGATVQFDFIGYDGLYDALLTGRVDVLASALVADEAKSADFAFSTPYFNAGQVLLTHTSSTVQSLDNLKNQTVAVELGAMGHVAATELDEIDIVTFAAPADVIHAVETGVVDAAIIDNITAQLNLMTDLIIVDPAVTVEPFALVVRAEDQVLLRRLNDGLEKLEESGKLEGIFLAGFGRRP